MERVESRPKSPQELCWFLLYKCYFPPSASSHRAKDQEGQKLGLALQGAPGGIPGQDLGHAGPVMSFTGFISHDQLLFCSQATCLPLPAALSRAITPQSLFMPLLEVAGAL